MNTRIEQDGLGQLEIPSTAYYGIHSLRAKNNFPLSGYAMPKEFIAAMAMVKQASAVTNTDLKFLDQDRGAAIVRACEEMAAGLLHDQVIVDPFQGGAGTSFNMNMNEVLANRAIEILGGELGDYSLVHPLNHVNMHQSTNDVFPTALAVAGLNLLKELETAIERLQACLQDKEQAFQDVVKAGRTELTDAVPVTLGMEFSAFAEAVGRDRWRVFKCRERLKKVSLGGTAVGTGVGAPRDYILKAAANLKQITGLPISRAENLVDATQNLDRFVEASAMLKAYGSNLIKICNDLRMMASGPDTGFQEITLPAVQTGSSIMAGKINPVVMEAAVQVGLQVLANDQTTTLVASMGQLELNHLAPLLAHAFLESLILLKNITPVLAENCRGIVANKTVCAENARKTSALATVLVPHLGYGRVEGLVKKAQARGCSLLDVLDGENDLDQKWVKDLLSPKSLYKLGFITADFIKRNT